MHTSNVMGALCGCRLIKFDSCNNLLSFCFCGMSDWILKRKYYYYQCLVVGKKVEVLISHPYCISMQTTIANRVWGKRCENAVPVRSHWKKQWLLVLLLLYITVRYITQDELAFRVCVWACTVICPVISKDYLRLSVRPVDFLSK